MSENRDADLDALVEVKQGSGMLWQMAENLDEAIRLCREARNGLAVEEAAGRDLHAEVERLREAGGTREGEAMSAERLSDEAIDGVLNGDMYDQQHVVLALMELQQRRAAEDQAREGAEEAWEADKHRVGRLVHEAWAREKQRQGFADHPFWPSDSDHERCKQVECPVEFARHLHHPDMVHYDALSPENQAYDWASGEVAYLAGFEAGRAAAQAEVARLREAVKTVSREWDQTAGLQHQSPRLWEAIERLVALASDPARGKDDPS